MSSHAPSIDIGLMRQLCAANPGNMPKVFVHDDHVWRGQAGAIAPMRIDNHGNLHMSMADFLVLKTLLPVSEVKRLRADMREFKIELLPHHMLGGVNDRKKPVDTKRQGKQLLRDELGTEKGVPMLLPPKRRRH